jgi:hypothetical protein
LQELTEFVGENAPAFTQVAIQRERLVLGEDENLAQIGIDAV